MEELLTKAIPGLLGSGPTTALLGYMWWTERKDRKQAEEEKSKLYERVLKLFQQIANSGESRDGLPPVS